MKRIVLYFGALAMMTLAAGSCLSEYEAFEPETPAERLPVNLYNEIEQVVMTRVNDNGFCDGDGVGVYVVNYENGQPGALLQEGNQADNVRYVFNEGEQKWTPDVEVFFRDKTTHVDVIGYYPYSNPASVTEYPFEVAKDQSTDAANGLMGGYEASDFLYAKTVDQAPSASAVMLNFQHAMAGAMVTLVEGTGFATGEFAGLEKAVLVSNTARKSTINLATGEITPDTEIQNTGIIPFKSGENFRAVVVPQTIPASTALFNITVDNVNYIFRKQADFQYIGGKLHKFSIQISKKTEGGLEFKLLGESITAWETDNVSHDASAREYIVIHCETPGGLKDAIVAAGKDITKVKNLKVTGTIDYWDFQMMCDEMLLLQSVNLKEITIAAAETSFGGTKANHLPPFAFYGKSTLLRCVLPDSIIAIEENAFNGTNLTGSIVIPANVSFIDKSAFQGCNSLSGELVLPKVLHSVGSRAFYGCSGLRGNLDMPNEIRYIGDYAFYGCNFTGALVLPKELDYLGKNAFYACDFTGHLTIPNNLTKIPEGCFTYCGFTSLSLPNGLLEIGKSAFSECRFRGVLKLPEGLITIGEEAFRNNQFTNIIFPSSLNIIGRDAFSQSTRLVGVVEIPEEVTRINEGVFNYCISLEGVVLPKNLEYIGSGAFSQNYQLNSIICKAQVPPTLEDPFYGVAKDNFTVEVPEAAVNDYITAPGWNEFKRFAAHRDFSISRNMFRTLNAGGSKTLVLRAESGAEWSIAEKPEWVTVSPESGTGKTEVTITVAEMPQGSENRTGDVKFLLNGKDYYTTTTVEQYNYEYGDGDVMTVQTASKGNGVNLVFMGDCFDAKDISEGKYLDGVNEAIGYFFDVEPYKSYRDYFNVYTVLGMSPDSGVGDVNTIREAKFGSAYALGGISPDEAVCFEYACKAETVTEENINQTLIVMVENTEDYGGICYMYGDGSAIAICPMSRDVYPYDFRGIVQHEAGGHGFGKLGDEYIYHNEFIQTCKCVCCPHVEDFNAAKARGWYDNLSLTGNMYDVPWSHLIFDPKYSNMVDIYEGGYMHMRGVFRSEPNSCMNNNIPYFSAISRESIVKRIMAYSGQEYSFEAFKEKDVLTASSPTKSDMKLYDWTYSYSNKQCNPVYMGEKPEFNANK